MVLLHCALLCEAQAFIEFYKLDTIEKKRVFKNDTILLVVLGIGKEKTLHLKYFYEKYMISKAINIGIAGTNDTKIEIGSIYNCVNRSIKIPYLPLYTVEKPQISSNYDKASLYDMEGKYFFEISKEFLDEKDIYIFKVISDYLDGTILPKDIIKQMIKKNIKKIDEYIR